MREKIKKFRRLLRGSTPTRAFGEMNTLSETIYPVYAKNWDMTFIMRDITDGEELKSMECVGWYYGEPDEESTVKFIGKLKAEFIMEE